MSNQNNPSGSAWNPLPAGERVLNETAFYDSLYNYHYHAIRSDGIEDAVDPLSLLTDEELAQLQMYDMLEQPPPPPPTESYPSAPLPSANNPNYLNPQLAYDASNNLSLSSLAYPVPPPTLALTPDHAAQAALQPHAPYYPPPPPPPPPPDHEGRARKRERNHHSRSPYPEIVRRDASKDRFERRSDFRPRRDLDAPPHEPRLREELLKRRERSFSPHHKERLRRDVPDRARMSPLPPERRDHRERRPRDRGSQPSPRARRDSPRRDQPADSSRKKRSLPADEYVPDVDSVLDIEEEVKNLTASYMQSTQHGNMYRRILHDDSTVEGTKKLKELYDRFEKVLSNRHKSLWKLNANKPEDVLPDIPQESPVKLNKYSKVTLNGLKRLDSSVKLTRHQRVKSTMMVKKMIQSAKRMQLTLPEYITQVGPTMPRFALYKLKYVVECGDAITEEDLDEQEPDEAGQYLNNIRKLKAHPDRLHEELWYNEPEQTNDGPLCRCAPGARSKGIRHGLYPNETTLPNCHPMKNNIGKLHHYRVMVGPAVNFMSSVPTLIKHNDHDYMFEGFSIFSHEPLHAIPFCDIIRFHIRYTIILIEETPPENFCMRGLDLFHNFFFREILELYDWQENDSKYPENTGTGHFRKFRFYPRFVRSMPDDGKEFLSLCKVLEYLLDQDRPLVDEKDLDYLLNCPHEEWLKYTDKIRGMIVTYPGKKPSSLRIDQLDRYNRKPVETEGRAILPVDERYPMIVHFGVRPANLSYAGDPTYQRIWRSYLKLRHLMVNSPRVKLSDKKKLHEREEAMHKIRKAKDMQREVTVELSSKGFRRTGIFSDMCQHALLLPVLTHHLRYYLCLAGLEEKIEYKFKERKWLSHAMNHPSSKMNFGLNPDHVRNALSNCGLRLPKYGDSSIHYKYTRKRGITNLIRIMARLGQHRPVLSPIEHNERLEFLGDAVVGYFTTVHLFLMFPELSEGSLTTFRTILVNNLHLATLAERLQLDEYMLYSHGPDLCRKADLRHAMANCFEALMGAVFLEAGLDKAQELYGKFLWETNDLQNVWKQLPMHPLQEEQVDSDRHFIENIPVLQKLTKLEDSIGLEFKHIRLLAKAFTWRNVHENVLTYGNNQRLEFLGDSVCNLVASEYLFRFYPTHHEGHLTLLRATMVNGQTQSMVATELGMPEHVICGSEERTHDWRVKNLADLLESFVAALYLDKGIKYVEAFMEVCFFPRLKEFILTQEWNDPKSCLQQCCLTLRQEGKEPQLPTYEVTSEGGPSHAKMFHVSVNFLGSEIGKGHGDCIRKAERNAARAALNDYNFPQLEWQRRYVAQKHDLPYQPRKKLKNIESKDQEKGEQSEIRTSLSFDKEKKEIRNEEQKEKTTEDRKEKSRNYEEEEKSEEQMEKTLNCEVEENNEEQKEKPLNYEEKRNKEQRDRPLYHEEMKTRNEEPNEKSWNHDEKEKINKVRKEKSLNHEEKEKREEEQTDKLMNHGEKEKIEDDRNEKVLKHKKKKRMEERKEKSPNREANEKRKKRHKHKSLYREEKEEKTKYERNDNQVNYEEEKRKHSTEKKLSDGKDDEGMNF